MRRHYKLGERSGKKSALESPSFVLFAARFSRYRWRSLAIGDVQCDNQIELANDAAPARMKTILPIVAALLLCQLRLGGSPNPPMTRIVTRYLSPEIQPGSFVSKPKT